MAKSHPDVVFVLSDGPQAKNIRYYTDVQETAKSLAAFNGWGYPARGTHALRFGRLTVMFSDRAQLDLTELVKPHVEEIRKAMKDAGHTQDYLPRDWAWRGKEDEQKAFNKLRSQVRDRLKGTLTHAVDEHLALLPAASEADLASLKSRLRDSIVAAVEKELA